MGRRGTSTSQEARRAAAKARAKATSSPAPSSSGAVSEAAHAPSDAQLLQAFSLADVPDDVRMEAIEAARAICNRIGMPSNDPDPRVIDDDGAAATEHGHCEDDADATEKDAGAATEHAEASASPLDLPAEFLIGIQEEDAHDPVDLMLVFQKNLELVQEAGKRIHNLEQRRVQEKGTEQAADAAMALTAEKAQHAAALVDLRKLAMKMGGDYQQRIQDALNSSEMKDAKANTPRTLHIRSGKPVNMFEAAAWPAAFVEFMYGDCAPNLARPRRVGIRELFYYLGSREELEYRLETDKDDPLIPGGCYRAPSQSRWNTPEFMAIFADVVRKLRILQTTKHMWEGAAPKWRIDIQAICDAKVEHFEQDEDPLTRGGPEHSARALLQSTLGRTPTGSEESSYELVD